VDARPSVLIDRVPAERESRWMSIALADREAGWLNSAVLRWSNNSSSAGIPIFPAKISACCLAGIRFCRLGAESAGHDTGSWVRELALPQ